MHLPRVDILKPRDEGRSLFRSIDAEISIKKGMDAKESMTVMIGSQANTG